MQRPTRHGVLLAGVLAVAVGLGAGCLQLQKAAGCNAPGLLGCRDEPTVPAEEETPPTPARDEAAPR